MVRIIIILFCTMLSAQETEKRVLLTPVLASDVANRLLECVDLEKVYHSQKIIINSYRTMENELRYSLEFQRSEADRLKRVNLSKDEIIESLYEDKNALQQAHSREKRKNGFFSVNSISKIAVGFLAGVITAKAISN